MLLAAAPALALPGALAAVAAVRLPIRWRWAILLSIAVYGGAAALALASSWNDNLRFAPWTDILAALTVALVAAALVAVAVVRRRVPGDQLRLSLAAVALWLAAIAVVLAKPPKPKLNL